MIPARLSVAPDQLVTGAGSEYRWVVHPPIGSRTTPITPRKGKIMHSDRITTAFDAESTAMQVITGIDLTGQAAIVTGASSGIGVETARALASAGADVTLAVRSPLHRNSTASAAGISKTATRLKSSIPTPPISAITAVASLPTPSIRATPKACGMSL